MKCHLLREATLIIITNNNLSILWAPWHLLLFFMVVINFVPSIVIMHVCLQQEHFLMNVLFPPSLRNGFISYSSLNRSWLLTQGLEKSTHSGEVEQMCDYIQVTTILAPGKVGGTFCGIIFCHHLESLQKVKPMLFLTGSFLCSDTWVWTIVLYHTSFSEVLHWGCSLMKNYIKDFSQLLRGSFFWDTAVGTLFCIAFLLDSLPHLFSVIKYLGPPGSSSWIMRKSIVVFFLLFFFNRSGLECCLHHLWAGPSLAS